MCGEFEARDSSLPGSGFAVAAGRERDRTVFSAPGRNAIQDRVVAHQELRTAGVAGIAVIDGGTLAREHANAVSLRQIAVDVRPAGARVAARNRRQVLPQLGPLVEKLAKRELVGLEPGDGRVARKPVYG